MTLYQRMQAQRTVAETRNSKFIKWKARTGWALAFSRETKVNWPVKEFQAIANQITINLGRS